MAKTWGPALRSFLLLAAFVAKIFALRCISHKCFFFHCDLLRCIILLGSKSEGSLHGANGLREVWNTVPIVVVIHVLRADI